MNIPISLDYFSRLKESIDELSFQANVLCQHVDILNTKTTVQIRKLEEYFKQSEKLCGTGVIPLYDRDNLYLFIIERFKNFNLSLDNLSEEKRKFKLILQTHEATIKEVILEGPDG